MADTKTTALSEVSIPELEDLLYFVEDPSGTPTSRKVTLARALGLMPGVPQLRLTTESGVPVSSSDRTSQGTLYANTCIPNGQYTGGIGFVTTWDGTRRRRQQVGDVSLGLTLTNDKVYDVFLKDSDKSLVLSTAWTTFTSRADPLDTAGGLVVADSDNTYLWLGTIHATGTNVTEDSQAKRHVWNAYNQVLRPLRVQETTDSWTYNSTVLRPGNNSFANQLSIVCGIATQLVEVFLVVSCDVINSQPVVGITVDGAGTISTLSASGYFNLNTGSTLHARLAMLTGIGLHDWTWLEACQTNNTVTFYGDAGGVVNGAINSGIFGNWWA